MEKCKTICISLITGVLPLFILSLQILYTDNFLVLYKFYMKQVNHFFPLSLSLTELCLNFTSILYLISEQKAWEEFQGQLYFNFFYKMFNLCIYCHLWCPLLASHRSGCLAKEEKTNVVAPFQVAWFYVICILY